nr:RNA-binding protein cabeza-like isoform X2 [Drosophila suzukii]
MIFSWPIYHGIFIFVIFKARKWKYIIPVEIIGGLLGVSAVTYLLLNQLHVLDWYDFPGYIRIGSGGGGGGGGGGGSGQSHYGKGKGGGGGGGRGKRSTSDKDKSDLTWSFIAFGCWLISLAMPPWAKGFIDEFKGNYAWGC